MDENYSFVVFIDESGDEGFKFPDEPGGDGSSEWFVLSAAIFRAENVDSQTRCVDLSRRKIKPSSTKPLHFRYLKHEQKLAYCNALSDSKFRIVNVAVYKPEISARTTFKTKGVLYHYASKLLLERVSWLCRDRFAIREHPVEGNGSARVIFSERRTFSTADFQQYLRALTKDQTHGIDWGIVRPDLVEQQPHDALAGLQIADVCASALAAAIETHRLGVTEPRYATILKHLYHNKEGRVLSYGLKVFPSPAIEQLPWRPEPETLVAG